MNLTVERRIGIEVRPAERQDCQQIYDLSYRTQLSTAQSTEEGSIIPSMESGGDDDDDKQQGRRPRPHRQRLMSAKELERDGFDTIPPLFHCLVATTMRNNGDQQRTRRDNDGVDEKSHNENNDDHGHPSSPSLHTCSIVVGYAQYFISYPVWEGKSIQLVNLCMDPEYDDVDRRRIGQCLLQELAKIAIDGRYEDIRMECESGNVAIVELLEQSHAINLTIKEAWNCFMIDREDMHRLALANN